jgi:hypothetical protein
MFQTTIVENFGAHILFSITFFENRAVYEMMWKNNSRAREATDNKMGYVPFTLYT